MKSRYIPITIIVAAFCMAAAAGYVLFPGEAQDVPARVVMENAGGRVLFTHKAHAEEYGFECTDCHHDDLERDTFLSCGSCHPKAFDETFRAEHPKAFPDKEACLRCHDEAPEGPLAEEDRPSTEDIPLRLDAFHGQCMSCHEENGGPTEDDSCYECHAR
ncbi:cytochrome c3 family protein [Salidesulfovibrio onnuriiensis]|uniref:cytochrome c3 family protein n=1 Tax=Salidesulfovibrio onnuriiensis TaxID=2583823 RepID=UPI0011C9D7A8|nr:cytochrome c3 family protein [Salidesulfovibrio onnuriiensis]